MLIFPLSIFSCVEGNIYTDFCGFYYEGCKLQGCNDKKADNNNQSYSRNYQNQKATHFYNKTVSKTYIE